MDKVLKAAPHSAYLDRPLRTYAQALADREASRQRMQPKASAEIVPLRPAPAGKPARKPARRVAYAGLRRRA
jgi:hypothetical protein